MDCYEIWLQTFMSPSGWILLTFHILFVKYFLWSNTCKKKNNIQSVLAVLFDEANFLKAMQLFLNLTLVSCDSPDIKKVQDYITGVSLFRIFSNRPLYRGKMLCAHQWVYIDTHTHRCHHNILVSHICTTDHCGRT